MITAPVMKEIKPFRADNFKKYSKKTNIEITKSKIFIEAVAQRYSVKKLYLEISQNSQENACARVSFLIKA